MKYQHIIWDWNGTLLNDAWLFVDIMNGVLSNRKLPLITVDDYRKLFCFPVKDYYKKLGFDLENESFEICGLEFIHAYEKRKTEADLYMDSVQTLSQLQSIGLSQSILSAQNQSTLTGLINHYQLNEYFTDIIGLKNHYAHSKVGIGQSWLQSSNYSPESILMVGDTQHDFEVANELGIDCLLISTGHNTEKRLTSTGEVVVNSLTEILSYLEIDTCIL